MYPPAWSARKILKVGTPNVQADIITNLLGIKNDVLTSDINFSVLQKPILQYSAKYDKCQYHHPSFCAQI